MRIPMKKLVSLLLCLALTFAMSSAFALDLGKYDEPITVTYLSTDRNVPSVAPYDESNPARKSARENTWIDGYLETLGIKLDRIIAEDATALNARINTGIASGDLPDIMLCSKEMFNVLCQNDVLADLTDPGRILKSSGLGLLTEGEVFLAQLGDLGVDLLRSQSLDVFHLHCNVSPIRQHAYA